MKQDAEHGAVEGFLSGAGALGTLIAAFDWAATPLGPIAHWPPALKTTVGLLLRSPVPIMVLWGDDGIMLYNDGFASFAGSLHPAMLGSRVREGWADIAAFNDNVMKVVLTGRTLSYRDQAFTLNRNGKPEPAWIDLDYSPVLDEHGQPVGVIAIVIETTAKIQAGRRLKITADALASLNAELEHRVAERTAERDRVWHNSRDLLVVVGADGIFRAVNPAWRAILGHEPHEITGHSFLEFVWPEDIARTQHTHDDAVARRDLTGFENRYRHKDGQPRWISWNTTADNGMVYASGRDITADKQQAEALLQSRTTLRTIFETSYQLQALLAPDGRVLDANATLLAVIEATLADVIGQPFWDTPWFNQTPGMPGLVREAVARAAAGESGQMTFCVNVASGPRSYDFSIRPLRDGRGDVVGIVPEAVDITERLHAEEGLRQAQKMEAVGQLTGGLAHDFNNLLTGIGGSLELLQTRLAQGRVDGADRYIMAAQGASKRAAALTHRLLAFSRRQTLDPKPTDINHLVSGMEELIRRTAGPAIETKVVGAAGVWPILVDPNQLENALLNLCINARDAMPDGGRLTIATGNKWMDERAGQERALPPGDYVTLRVSDTGSGMTPEVVRRAFDPFFTTKPIGLGTGLGLSMIYGFMQQSGGLARIHSKLDQGATVCLYLPRHTADPGLAETAYDGVAAPQEGQGETVLVVDDEPSVRMLVAETLAELGYITIEAADGPGALQVMRSKARIDLLVTDVGLPGGMNGRQVADAARSLRPGLQVLFITGYADNAAVGNGHLEHGMHVLTKPFAFAALADRVRRIIGAAHAA